MFSNTEIVNGVFFFSKQKDNFSTIYLDVRNKEERLYSDDVVKYLPNTSKSHRYYQEWKLRESSANRIKKYLLEKNRPLKILDLGCGNGWFSNQLALIPNVEVIGVDVNTEELTQGARVFQLPNLKFACADIFSNEAKELKEFDIITINACIQYFEDFQSILNQLREKLNFDGELHIIDSPFYRESEVQAAKKRSSKYYRDLGFPEMKKHYFHHCLESIGGYDILYQSSKSIIDKLLRKRHNPFMWLRFLKT